jgi:hypothetical protein
VIPFSQEVAKNFKPQHKNLDNYQMAKKIKMQHVKVLDTRTNEAS